MAWRLTSSVTAMASAVRTFMNFRRAAWRRTGPHLHPARAGRKGRGWGAPISRLHRQGKGSPPLFGREVRVRRATEPIEEAPRAKPSVAMRNRSIRRPRGRQLGGGVTFQRQGQFFAAQLSRRPPPGCGRGRLVDLDLNAGRPHPGRSHQLLDRTGRALDHLAGGDAVDGLGGRRRWAWIRRAESERPGYRHPSAKPR